MNIKDLLTLLILILAVGTTGCTSLDRNSNEEIAIPSVEADSATVETDFPAEGWIYRIETTNQGSRSEGSVARLFYRYAEVPPVFSRILIGASLFEYVPAENIWDNSGYIFRYGEFFESSEDQQTISRYEMRNGWYKTDAGSIKNGTPKNWVYVETDGMSAWVGPERLIDFAELFSLQQVDGSSLLSQLE